MSVRWVFAMVFAMVLVVGSSHAETQISAELQFTLVNASKLSEAEQAQLGAKLVEALQARLKTLVQLKDFSSSAEKGTVFIRLWGEWQDKQTAKDAVERLRQAAIGPQDDAQKAVLAKIRVEVKELGGKQQGREHEIEMVTKGDPGKHGPPARGMDREGPAPFEDGPGKKEKDRSGPRLNVVASPDKKAFEEFTAVDVPLARVLDLAGKLVGLSYVLDHKVAWAPVFVSIRGVTIDQALTAIAESTHLKIERRAGYVTFVPETR